MRNGIVVALLAAPYLYCQNAAGLVDFERQIHPILASKCLSCHSQEKRSGGLSLSGWADVIEGGRSGASIKPGNSGSSLLVARITGETTPRMPLGRDALSPAEIGIIRLWIDQGARSSPGAEPAKAKWEPPLSLTAPPFPDSPWKTWSSPVDRFVAAYMAKTGQSEPRLVSDAQFARRAWLDIQGLLPPPEALEEFVRDPNPDKRRILAERLLADNRKYAEHWISFWNDLLRNDEGVNYYSETASRKSITQWLMASLESNLPYDRFVAKLLNPTAPSDPDGFLIGVNWRGVVSASQTPAMQAAQNTAQIFLGINLKCNSCHDSFISKWKLKDAYALASYFSPEEKLEMYRCDIAQGQYAAAAFLYPELNRPIPSGSLADRRAAAAAIFTDPRNGRLARTLVNRIWQRLMGRGIVENVDEMDGEPWSPELLDWLASDFVTHGYDIKRLIATIVGSRAYQLPAVPRNGEQPNQYVFSGPEIRRLTAEQFADAIASITGDWHIAPAAAASPAGPEPGIIPPGNYSREWRIAANNLTRALGRPIRDQVYSTRDSQATTIQAIELVNGETLTHWLLRGARRMLGELPPEPQSLFARAINGSVRPAQPVSIDIDISPSRKLYLIVQDALSTAPDKAAPVWAQAELIGPKGATPLSALKPIDASGLREGAGPVTLAGTQTSLEALRVKFPSVVVYDIAGKGFTRFRATAGLENVPLAQGETVLSRFFIFDREPSMDRLVPPNPETPLPRGPVLTTVPAVVNRIFTYALGREPSPSERRIAGAAISDSARSGKPSAEGLADLLWAVLMKPEFQLIY